MKKLIYTLLAFATVCFSCVQDVDDVYDKPVAQRVEEAVQEYHDLLVSSEHGWLMEYYPHSSQIYGGFNYIMKFKGGDKVTISTDAFGKPEETEESLFSIKKDIGPTLNFDTYNSLFHYFSDSDISGGAGTGKGYEGDYEFLLRSHTENEIVLRGKKTKNIIRMTRLAEDATPYLAAAIRVDEEMNRLEGVLGFSGMMNGKELALLYTDSHTFNVVYDGQETSTSFMPTATGIQFKGGDKVTISTDAFGKPEETEESLFSIKKDIGPTLNFDTYNSLFHYFSDSDISGGAGTGKGYEGDYEFLLRSHTENEIVLRGKKTKNIIRMTRLAEDATPYLAAAIRVDEEMNRLEGVLGFSGMMNGKELALLYTDSHTFNVVYDGQETSTSFMPTATGIQFYLPVEVGGKELHRFTWSAANETLVAENAPDVVLKVDYDPEYIIYAQYLGKYTMNYRRGENTPVLSLEIELVKKEDMKSYTIKGMLPIDLTMIYNKAERRMELLNQKLTDGSEAYLSIWMVNPGSLTYGGTDFVNGMYGKLKEGSDNEYEFVDDGRKADFVTRGMILWSKAGEYKAYAESRFAFITLVKHE